MNQLVPYLRPYLPAFIGVFILTLVNIYASKGRILLFSQICQKADQIGLGQGRIFRMNLVWFYLLESASTGILGYLFSWVAARVIKKMREDLVTKVVQAPPSFFDQNTHGEVLSKVSYQLEMGWELLSGCSIGIIKGTAGILAPIYAAASVNPFLCASLVVWIGLIYTVWSFFAVWMQRESVLMQTGMQSLLTELDDLMKGHTVVWGAQDPMARTKAFWHQNKRLEGRTQYYCGLACICISLIQFIYGLWPQLLLMFLIVDQGRIKTQFSINSIACIAISSCFTHVGIGIFRLMGSNFQIQRGLAGFKDFFGFMEQIPARVSGSTDLVFNAKSSLELKDIHFIHPHANEYLFRGCSLQIPLKQWVLIQGSNGSGKSTLLQLLTRNYEVETGQVLINGLPIDQYNLASLHRAVLYLPQKPYIFRGTLRDNIVNFHTQSFPKAEEIMEEVLSICAISPFLPHMPHGLDTQVGEGAFTLSEGQLQRIHLARGLLQDPEVLILDESTSALDESTHQEVLVAVKAFRTGKSTLVISHHPSASVLADQLISLDAVKEAYRHSNL